MSCPKCNSLMCKCNSSSGKIRVIDSYPKVISSKQANAMFCPKCNHPKSNCKCCRESSKGYQN